MKRIFLHLTTGLLMTVFFVCGVNAQSVSIWDGTSEIWTQGNGTESSPFLIQNAQQLAYIADMVNNGLTHYENTYFKLTTNVQIDSTTAWNPIGLNSSYYFSGHFDGDNHVITLYQHVGGGMSLFGQCQNATIGSLNVGGHITAGASSAGIVGSLCGNSIIVNCSNMADIVLSSTSDLNAGGIACYLSSDNTIVNCQNTGNIMVTTASSNTSRAGGIVGICHISNNTIKWCNNSGNVTITSVASESGSAIHAGGIIGVNGLSNNIFNCSNSGTITSTVTMSAYSYSHAGGIVGFENNSQNNICKCYNTGVISSTAKYYARAGGIIGMSNGTNNSITYCYNTGLISSTSNVLSNTYAGGIVGSNWNYPPISNCYNAGGLIGSHKGGICGYMSGGDIVNCYYREDCGHNNSTGGISKTSPQMKSSSFPVLLNTDSVVYVKDFTPNINNGYPVFGTVSTLDADSIGSTTATLHGNYQLPYDVDVLGFEYKKNNENNYTSVIATGYTSVSQPLTNLQEGTLYTYRFFVQKGGVYYRGADKTFNTLQCALSVQITTNSNTLCEGDTVLYTAIASSSTPSQCQYVWNTGDSNNTIIVTDGSFYSVTVTDAYGCSTIQTKQMMVYPVSATISGDTVLCNNGNITLMANGGTSYSWNTGSIQPIITVDSPGTYIVTVQTDHGCVANDTVEVVAFTNPVITGNTSFCSGDYTSLTASGGDNYLWSTGATTPIININEGGTYTVTASTNNGCSGSSSVTITQNQINEVIVSGNTMICDEIGTILEASLGSSYIWSTGDTSPSIDVFSPGIYSVTVTDINGCSSSNTTNVTMAVQLIIIGDSCLCQGSDVQLTATGASSYTWSNGSSNAAITVNNTGTYTVSGTDANGCTNTATKTVSVNPTYNIPLTHSICQGENYNFYGQNLTTAGIYTHTLQTVNGCDSVLTLTLTVKALPTLSISGNTTVCEGQTTTLTANGGNSYTWNNGSTNNNITVSQSGVYTVTATNMEGCSATAQVSVNVNPLPNITINGNTTICEGSSTTLTASGADTYSWSTGDNTASVNISAFGVYAVTGTSSAGCSSTANVTVLVSQLPVITITGETDICAGESTTLTANGGTTYLWSNGNTEATFTTSQAGTYQVIGYNEAGCNAMSSATVNVWQPTTSEFSVECPDSCYTWNGQAYCASGDYTQTLQTVHGCDSVVTLHLTITVGVDDYDDFDFKVYPNPTSNIVNVECIMKNEEWGGMELHLCDAYGRLLDVVGANNHSPSRAAQIDLSRYASGVYFVKLIAEDRVITVRKVVKQ